MLYILTLKIVLHEEYIRIKYKGDLFKKVSANNRVEGSSEPLLTFQNIL